MLQTSKASPKLLHLVHLTPTPWHPSFFPAQAGDMQRPGTAASASPFLFHSRTDGHSVPLLHFLPFILHSNAASSSKLWWDSVFAELWNHSKASPTSPVTDSVLICCLGC